MSSDLVPAGGFSVVQSSSRQNGPHGPRMILGPFRFVNHDCNPNCQIMTINQSNACTIVSLRFIAAGEAITVSYTASGYHDPTMECLCGSCHPNDPPRLLRPVYEPGALAQQDNP
ncbi:hypothetical protein OF83DRAFT_1050933 [Amylostereum chailletii]|nr:hypothetical protein OF83DRAFT_1050933 [Amylostereum chailletii]